METTALWWISLGVGLVVALVTLGLLHALLTAVRRVDGEVRSLWETATRVAANTATTWLLAQTPDFVGELKQEALRHDDFVSSRSSG